MGPKKRSKKQQLSSPAQKSAQKIKRKYGRRMTLERRQRVRRALYEVSENKSIRQAAENNNLSYSFLQRRISGDVIQFSINGPPTVFTESEEEAMAKWLSEMSQRGMGLKMCEFIDFVQSVVKQEKRQTPFKDGRPGKKWYYSFMKRNSSIVSQRVETSLELKRSQLTKEKLDPWYDKFREFLQSKGLIDQPGKIWNADETGFNMGGNKSKVIGPAQRDLNVLHISCGKQRLTVMFCGNAAGQMMPPFYVYPEPKPKGYNPLNGSIEGSQIAYTPKGWMDRSTFSQFIDHFNKHAGNGRPVVFLFDSVSSHVDHDVFMKAKSLGIELYRIVPNATHLMQPLDKGVFGPLKTKWHMTARKYTRENPGKCIGKENFAEKLKEAFLQFYKPLTVINAFKSSGIYPVDSTVVTRDMLKPSLPYVADTPSHEKDTETEPQDTRQISEEQRMARGALEVFEKSLNTPVRLRYSQRIQEGFDVEGMSPCFDVYKKLHSKANPSNEVKENVSALDLLANLAAQQATLYEEEEVGTSLDISIGTSRLTKNTDDDVRIVSPVLAESLVFPKAAESTKPKRQLLIDSLPDNLTSLESIRQFSLKELKKIQMFADREKKAKLKFQKKMAKLTSQKNKKKKALPKSKKTNPHNCKSKVAVNKNDSSKDEFDLDEERANDTRCQVCHSTEEDDEVLGIERLWIQCDACDSWMHADCLAADIDFENTFICPRCSK